MRNLSIFIIVVTFLAALVAGGGFAQETPPEEAATEPEPSIEAEVAEPVSLTFETTVDFELIKSIPLDGRAGEIEFRGVEFTAAASKGGVFGSSDSDLKGTVTVMLDCSTAAEKKAKVDLTIQFLDGDGEIIDRVSDSAGFKAGSKTVQLKLTTLKYVVPLIKSAKITAVAKD